MMLFCLWCGRFLTHLHPEVYSTSCLPWKWKVWLDTGGMAVWTSYWKHMSTAVQTVAAAALVGWPWSTLSTAHSYRKLRPDQEPGSLLVSLPTNQKAFTKYFSGFFVSLQSFFCFGPYWPGVPGPLAVNGIPKKAKTDHTVWKPGF